MALNICGGGELLETVVGDGGRRLAALVTRLSPEVEGYWGVDTYPIEAD